MADSIFDTPTPSPAVDDDNIFGSDSNVEITDNVEKVDVAPVAQDDDTTYSQEEFNDPNTINVSISDENSPLVIFFGPPKCGKTMTLVRLTRYLNKQGYEVSPIKNFRPVHDVNYKKICDGFDNLICSDDAAAGTDRINFMLVQVMKNGRRICQLLEAPGEHYFDSKKPNAPFKNFINTIINKKNRKIWSIMVEPDWLEPADRKNYVMKIQRLKTKMRPVDKAIVIFNKIDKTSYVVGPGRIHQAGAIKEVKDLYPGIFTPFANVHPISKFWREFNCKFVPFQTGDYSVAASGKQTFQEGPEEYPRLLWKELMSLIRG